MMRRAAVEASKRAVLVIAAAAIVVLIGLTVFNRDDHLNGWVWRFQVWQETGQ